MIIKHDQQLDSNSLLYIKGIPIEKCVYLERKPSFETFNVSSVTKIRWGWGKVLLHNIFIYDDNEPNLVSVCR